MKERPNTPPSSLEAHLGFWLRFVSNHVSNRFQHLLETEGVTVSEWVALRTVWEHQSVTPAALIQALGMTKGAISKVMTKLEEKGLAQRQGAHEHLKDQLMVLTARGAELVPRLAALADENDSHFFGHLAAEERTCLMAAMRALVDHHQLQTLPTA